MSTNNLFPSSDLSKSLISSIPPQPVSMKRKRYQDKKIADVTQKRYWNENEDKVLLQGVKEHGHKWAKISSKLDGRNRKSCRTRWVVLSQPPSNKTPVSNEEKHIILKSLKDSECITKNARTRSGFAYRWIEIAKRVNEACHRGKEIRKAFTIQSFVSRRLRKFLPAIPNLRQLSTRLIHPIHNDQSFSVKEGLPKQALADFVPSHAFKIMSPEPLLPSSGAASSQIQFSFDSMPLESCIEPKPLLPKVKDPSEPSSQNPSQNICQNEDFVENLFA